MFRCVSLSALFHRRFNGLLADTGLVAFLPLITHHSSSIRIFPSAWRFSLVCLATFGSSHQPPRTLFPVS
ncbi:hypothetical protein VTI74DRAFT_3214 [Chaetomium olivicolor]